MINTVKYIVYEPSSDNHLMIVDMVDYMKDGNTREIVFAGNMTDMSKRLFEYTRENPYMLPALEEKEKIQQARLNAGKDRGDVRRVEYPLIPNNVLTPEEKRELLSKAFEDAAYLLHAAFVYTNTLQTVDCSVKMNSGEEYQMSFKRNNL